MFDRAIAVAASWVFVSLGPGQARHEKTPPSSRHVLETLTILRRNGQIANATPQMPRRELGRAFAFRKLSGPQMDSITQVKRELLLALSRPVDIRAPMRRGLPALRPHKARMSRLLVVLEALTAGSEAEFHAIVSRLGVGIDRTPTHDAQGRPVIRTEYSVDGTVSVRRVTTLVEDAPERPLFGGPSAEAAEMSNDCEYTDPDGVYWSGECATQQQLDDAAAILAATNADMEDVQGDSEGDLDYCQQVLDDCWETQDPLVLESSPWGPSAEASCFSNPFGKCYTQTVAMGLSMAGYFRQAYKLGLAVTAINPVGGAVFDAAFTLALIAGSAYLAGRALSDCLQT